MKLVVVTFKQLKTNGEQAIIYQPLVSKYLAKSNIRMEYWKEKLLEIKKFSPVGVTEKGDLVCVKY